MRGVKSLSAVAKLFFKPKALLRCFKAFGREALASNTCYERLYYKYRDFSMIPSSTFQRNLELIDRFRLVKGCVIECGVWRGGSIASIAELLGSGRNYHLFDSFQGLPPAQEVDGLAAQAWQSETTSSDYHDNCAAAKEYAEQAMWLAKTNRFQIHAGWFHDTLPRFSPYEPIAILRLDADWYDSTMTCLNNLYPHMSPGGLIIVDDYNTWDGCSRALHDFLAKAKSHARIQQWDNDVTYLTIPTPTNDIKSQP
jgi:O-methyltransferase